jgi:hypothetical protein
MRRWAHGQALAPAANRESLSAKAKAWVSESISLRQGVQQGIKQAWQGNRYRFMTEHSRVA